MCLGLPFTGADAGAASVTGAGTRVREGCTRVGDEAPVVGVRMKRQSHDAEDAGLVDLGVRQDRAESGEEGPTGPDDELPDAVRVDAARGVLRGEPLVRMGVS